MLGCYLTCPSKIPTLHTFLKEIAVALPKDFTNQSYYYYFDETAHIKFYISKLMSLMSLKEL